MPQLSDSALLWTVCIVVTIFVLYFVFGKRHENYGDAMHAQFIPFDLKGQEEMCNVILADPDMKGSGLTKENCNSMPLTAFNQAMRRSHDCKMNMCGVVGSPTPNTKECVKMCKQSAYLSSIYSSYGYNRD